MVDIYVQTRNARKKIILVEGLKIEESLLKNYSKELRKKLNCSCSISKKNGANILKLSSKEVEEVKSYLINNLGIKKENITIHGDI